MILAKGFKYEYFLSFNNFPLTIIIQAAPSDNCDAFPAVTVPFLS